MTNRLGRTLTKVEPFRLFAATGDAVAQLASLDGETVDVSLNLEGRGVMCIALQIVGIDGFHRP
jgi:hypothetical protein